MSIWDLHTFARGARQFVVQLAFETISMLGLYVISLTPTTNIGASADGADMTTFLAPPYKEVSRKWGHSVSILNGYNDGAGAHIYTYR